MSEESQSAIIIEEGILAAVKLGGSMGASLKDIKYYLSNFLNKLPHSENIQTYLNSTVEKGFIVVLDNGKYKFNETANSAKECSQSSMSFVNEKIPTNIDSEKGKINECVKHAKEDPKNSFEKELGANRKKEEIKETATNFQDENMNSGLNPGNLNFSAANEDTTTDNIVFGASVSAMLELDRRRCPGVKIPLIYQWILSHLINNGLKEEGLLRLAGSVQKIQALKTEIERSYATSPSLVENLIRQSSAIDISVLLKQLVRHLPEPLLTNSHMDAFLLVPNIPNVSDQMNILNMLILAMPDGNRELLQELLYFLGKVVEDEESNRMSLTNVAMIMAPNLFPPPRLKKSNHKNNDLATEVTVAAMSSKVTQLLIKYRNLLGTVPSELLAQAMQNQRTSNKNQGKRGGRKLKADKQKNSKDETASSTIIRVQVPSVRHTRGVVVPVNDRTTARDVVENVADALEYIMDPRNQNKVTVNEQENRAFLQRPRTTSEPLAIKQRCLLVARKTDCLKEHYLYLIRENVGERRLDHNTNISSIIGSTSGRFATGTTWEIRCHH